MRQILLLLGVKGQRSNVILAQLCKQQRIWLSKGTPQRSVNHWM